MLESKRVGVVAMGGETSGVPTLRSLRRRGFQTFLFIDNRKSIICKTKNLTGGIFKISHTSPNLFKKIYYICLKYKIFKLIVLDEELKYIFIKNKKFLKHVNIVLPSLENYEIALKKHSSSKFAKKINVPVPKTFSVKNKNELSSLTSILKYPVVVKGERGNSSLHVRYANNFSELKKYFDEIVLLEKAVDSASLPPMIQEYIGGPTYLSQAIVQNGKVKIVIPHYKFREWPLTGGVTSRAKTITEPKLVNYMTLMLESLEWNGEAGMEWKYDEKRDDFFFLEMNPRFEGSLDIAITSGSNFPSLLVDIMDDKELKNNLEYHSGMHYRWFFSLDFRCFLYGKSNIYTLIKESLDPRIKGEVSLNDINLLISFLKGPIYEIVNFIRK